MSPSRAVQRLSARFRPGMAGPGRAAGRPRPGIARRPTRAPGGHVPAVSAVTIAPGEQVRSSAPSCTSPGSASQLSAARASRSGSADPAAPWLAPLRLAAQRTPARAAPAGASSGHPQPQAERVTGLIGSRAGYLSQVSECPGHPEHPVESAGTNLPEIKGSFQRRERTWSRPESPAQFAARDLPVELPRGIPQAIRRALPCCSNPVGDLSAGFGKFSVAEQLTPAYRKELDLHVDPIQQWPRQPGQVSATFRRRAFAGGPPTGAFRTRARISRKYQVNRAGKRAMVPKRATTTSPDSRGCRKASSTSRPNSGASSRNRQPRCASEAAPGWIMPLPPPTIAALVAVWCGRAEGRLGQQRASIREHACHRVDRSDLQGRRPVKARQHRRNPFGQHGFARARWPEQAEMMPAGSAYLGGPARCGLA